MHVVVTHEDAVLDDFLHAFGPRQHHHAVAEVAVRHGVAQPLEGDVEVGGAAALRVQLAQLVRQPSQERVALANLLWVRRALLELGRNALEAAPDVFSEEIWQVIASTIRYGATSRGPGLWGIGDQVSSERW